MSKDDWWVDPLRDQEVYEIAKRARRYFDVDNLEWIDIFECLQASEVLTSKGVKKLSYVVKRDEELEDDAAFTFLDEKKDTIVVTIRQSISRDAKFGVGRARMTLAHELAHAVLHPGIPKARKIDQDGLPAYRIPAHKSAEHQAKVFAAAFLTDEKFAADAQSASDLSEIFGISLQAAEILYSRIDDKRERTRNAALIRKMADDCMRDLTQPRRQPIPYLRERCTACGAPKLIPDCNRYRCDECGQTSDKFQDGDQVE